MWLRTPPPRRSRQCSRRSGPSFLHPEERYVLDHLCGELQRGHAGVGNWVGRRIGWTHTRLSLVLCRQETRMAQIEQGKAAIHIAYIVTAVWVASFLADLFIETYEPRPEVQALMLAAAGFLFGSQVFKKNSGKNGVRHE
jgi:hypothetical protein